jgi:tyrosinase
VDAAGEYTIETSGPTDVLLSVFGPDTETLFVAFDDDSGSSYNARVVNDLGPGTYTVRVRHYSPSGTGQYGVSVGRTG